MAWKIEAIKLVGFVPFACLTAWLFDFSEWQLWAFMVSAVWLSVLTRIASEYEATK